MAVTLGSNIASLRTQRTLRGASDALAQSYQRLASGSRLTRASDDAAGLAVSDRLGANARLYSAASRNLSDGISALAIIDGTLDNQTQIIGRLSELAEQAANGTLSNAQRKTLDTEYQALIKEFGRIGDATLFNGISLLRQGRVNEFAELILQAGITGDANSRLTISGVDSGSKSGVFNRDRRSISDFNGDENNDFLDGNEAAGGASFSLEELRSRFGGEMILQEITDSSGQTLKVAVGLYEYTSSDLTTLVFVEDAATGLFRGITKNGTNIVQDSQFGVQLDILNFDSAGRITNNNGRLTFDISQYGLGNVTFDLSGVRFLTTAELGARDGASTNTTLIEATDIMSSSSARNALEILRSRLSELSEYRGKVGAIQSRVTVARNLVEAARVTSEEARSRVRDVDIASEAAQLAKLSILQQVSAALLGQANQQPALALTLLR